MSLFVFSALLAAAFLHAGWNALVRRDPDRAAATIAMAAGGVVVGLAAAPFLPPIDPAAIPFVLGSSCIHIVYFALVARAYSHAELSVAYPIMRGLAPVLVAVVGLAFLGEYLQPLQFAGIVLVATGIVTLGLGGWRRGRHGIAAALLNAGVIAAYTLVDGLGARASGAPAAYTAWILVGGGTLTVGWSFIRQGMPAIAAVGRRAAIGIAGGIMGFGAYGIALWAMTVAPIGAVAAVRESSVLFAAALGAVFLGERFGPARWAAAALVVAGLVLVRFGT